MCMCTSWISYKFGGCAEKTSTKGRTGKKLILKDEGQGNSVSIIAEKLVQMQDWDEADPSQT